MLHPTETQTAQSEWDLHVDLSGCLHVDVGMDQSLLCLKSVKNRTPKVGEVSQTKTLGPRGLTRTHMRAKSLSTHEKEQLSEQGMLFRKLTLLQQQPSPPHQQYTTTPPPQTTTTHTTKTTTTPRKRLPRSSHKNHIPAVFFRTKMPLAF